MNNTNILKDITHGLPAQQTLKHYIKFGPFDSRRFKLNLHERTAPTPDEKEVLISIPYRQGVVDISKLIGNRVFENREITFTFYRFSAKKGTARDFQTTIENLLMSGFNQRLDDSYEPDFYYQGKCREVTFLDEYDKRRLRIEITFDLYPFKVDKNMEITDLFDPFNFDLDAFQNGLTFMVTNEPKTIQIYNASQLVVRPEITASESGITLSHGNQNETLLEGTFTYHNFRLAPGINTISLHKEVLSEATVAFNWRKERI
jgi:phage-related protein